MVSHMPPLAIPLKEVDYDIRARDGTWCCHIYENHSMGCPNFIRGCTSKRIPFVLLKDKFHWYAIVEEFNLKFHAEKMKIKHPLWTERQCRNPLYWQGAVRKHLRDKANSVRGFVDGLETVLLDIPEAHGVDVFKTMTRVGVFIEQKPDVVRKVMLVGVEK